MRNDDFVIRPETPRDYRAVEELTREAFWNVYRPGCYEHYVVHTYRRRPDFIPELSLVMERNRRLIGHIMYVKASITCDDGTLLPMVTAGPLSILPDCQRQGYGKALFLYSNELAARLGFGCLCFEGNIDFYGKCGCVLASTRNIFPADTPREEPAPYFLCKELRPGFLDGISGVYHTPEGYFLAEQDINAFDATFPLKQKLKLPTQLF